MVTITALVLDPYRPLLDLIKEVLERDGHRVHVAGNLEDAVMVLREYGSGNFQLIMADPETPGPGMGGYALVALLRKRYPRLKFLFMVSRGGLVSLDLPLLTGGEIPLLEKPFDLTDLHSAVAKALSL